MKYYLYYYLHFSQLNAIKYHTGSVIWALDVEGFKENEKIALPDWKVLAAFSEIMGTIFQRRLLNNKQTSTLTVVRDMLLPRLMSGKIRVPISKEKVETVGYA
jgi:type I restriction enzyme, S subunit